MEVQIDWDHLFDFDLTFSGDANSSIIPTHGNNNQSPLSVDDIEQLLFKDEDDGFLVDDILLDSPLDGIKSGEVVDLEDRNKEVKDTSDDDDPLDKKRKRQLRNKDAALRSRERKKMHVKDLELKSKYYEGECRRLGSLLQWYMAENQALRFSLHSGSGTSSMTKQESAVLFLESLLLGSLLWLMGLLPSLLLPVPSQSQGKHLPTQLVLLVLRKGGSRCLSVGKRFKASRSRMRRLLQLVTNVF